MTVPTQNHNAWKISVTVLHAISITLCIARLANRKRLGHMWWDDKIMVVPLIFNIIYIIYTWVKFGTGDITWSVADETNFFTSAWFGTFLYFSITWIPRISLLLSLARILPPHRPPWILVYCSTALFSVIYLANVIITTVTCPGDSVWWKIDMTRCITTNAGEMIGTVVGVTLDFVADLILIAFPVAMLYNIRVEDRVLVLVLFCSSIITILASIGYCTVWYMAFRIGPESRLIFNMFAHIQANASLISANLLIVVMMLHRRFRRRVEEEESKLSSSQPQSTREPYSSNASALTGKSNLEVNSVSTKDSQAASGRSVLIQTSGTGDLDSQNFCRTRSTGLYSLYSFLAASHPPRRSNPSSSDSSESRGASSSASSSVGPLSSLAMDYSSFESSRSSDRQ